MIRANQGERRAALQTPPDRVVKLCGEDTELGNFITGVESGQATGAVASRALLSWKTNCVPGRRTIQSCRWMNQATRNIRKQ